VGDFGVNYYQLQLELWRNQWLVRKFLEPLWHSIKTNKDASMSLNADKKGYRVRIVVGTAYAYLFCVSYPLDLAKSHYGLDFYEVIWSSDLVRPSFPQIRATNFREELLIFHRASASHDAVPDEVGFIATKMKDVYGDEATIHISSIDEKLQPGGL
jgi:hypothetical protein